MRLLKQRKEFGVVRVLCLGARGKEWFPAGVLGNGNCVWACVGEHHALLHKPVPWGTKQIGTPGIIIGHSIPWFRASLGSGE